MEKILISACLLGEKTKYDGTSNQVDWIDRLSKYYDLVPFCPEVEGGLSIPRKPAEIKNGMVKTKDGKDVTYHFNNGAEKAYNICKHAGITLAILKENSPSCGVYTIYDGFFRDKLIKGSGITTTLLKNYGIKVMSENEVESFLTNLEFQTEQQRLGREKNIALDKEAKEKGVDRASLVEPKEEKKNFNKSKKFRGKKSSKKFDHPIFVKFENDIDLNPGENETKKEGFEKKISRNRRDFKKNSFRKDGEKRFDRKSYRHHDDDGFKKSFHKDDRKSFGDKKDGKSFKKSFKKFGDKNKKFSRDGERHFDKKKSFSRDNKKGFSKRKSYGSKKSYSK